MKRRADELLVGVKQSEPSSVVPPTAASALGPGVCPPGVRGPTGLGAVAPPHTVVLSRQSPAPQQIAPQLQQHLLSIPTNSQCVLTTNSIPGPPGPTVVQAFRTSSPVVSKSDAAPPNMPGSIQYPVQSYSNPVPSAAPKGSAAAGAPAPVAGSSAVISRNLGASRPPNKVPRPSMSRPLPPSRSGSIDGASPQVPVMPPTQPSGNLSSAQQSQQQQQFQRLKVEDALSYLDQVKFKFGSQPQVYNDFLDIMKEFKSQSIDTPGVIARVSNLFKGHPELIVGFNTFLPPGYKIEVQANDQGYAFQVSVSMPSPTNTNSVGTVTQHHTLPISTSATGLTQTIVSTIPTTAAPPAPVPVVVTQQTVAPPAPSVPSKPLTTTSSAAPIGLAAVHHAATSLHGYSTGMPPSSSPHHPQSGSQPPSIPLNTAPAAVGGGPSLLGHAGAMLAETMQPTPQSQPVDFSHAINYVNKIKHRFQGTPDKYKSFLDILHAYQKEQRSVKDGMAAPGKQLTEAEVYAQVAKLFENQDDLVQEFGQFLPDATSHQAALMGAVLQGSKGLSNDHSSNKKPLGLKPSFNNANASLSNISMGSMSTSSKFGQVKRSSPFSSSSQPMKKPKVTACLRDVSLAEAGKLCSLNDYAFFDKVRKALKNPDIYENFLRCLSLFNHEIVSGTELVQLVTPFLSRFPELLKWFKEFLGHNDSMVGNASYQSLNNLAMDTPANSSNRQERATGDLAMEIDYSTCKRLGASYCALPKNYAHSKCSGRTPLCKEVLNDTWVSFPTWSSEDSTFVTSRKTQFEESIYRCEDERFELDVVLETNSATIRVLEGVNKKMSRMQPDELTKYHLDDCLGGTSATIHQRAIRRIYGDKASDIIMGLKKNPSTAVPVVLKRLKAKEEEWREAQKGFNKIWREQNEKYYLKSLDHQGINFKQNDLKTLRSKALFNEIESLYDERHEQAEDGHHHVTGPHMVLRYRDKSILDDAANLLIHHVKRQTSIHKEDKQNIKHLLKQVLPDIFFHPRQDLSEDERDDDGSDKDDSEGCSPSSKKSRDKREPDKKSSSVDISKSETKEKQNAVVNNFEESKGKEDLATPAHAISSDPDEHYTLFVTCNTWYCFLRLHQILCERLTRMYECAKKLVAEDALNKIDRKESTAIALRLKPKSDIDIEDYYPAFLDMVKNLLDNNMDTNAYEDTLREMFGIHAYIAFTLDKVVTYAVRQLQQLAMDDISHECLEIFNEEKKRGAAGGPCSKAAQSAISEMAYQKRVEQVLTDENCYKIFIYKNDCRMTVELLDTDGEEQEAPAEAEKREEYVEKYVGEMDSIPDEMKERLSRKPVFLPRCVRGYIDRSKRFHNQERSSTAASTSGNDSPSSSNEQKDADSKSDDEKKKDGSKVRADSPQSGSIDSNECRFNPITYSRVFFMDKDALLFKKNALLNAKEAHPRVTIRLLRKFRDWHQKWASVHVSEDQQKSTTDWLMGLGDNMMPNRTRILTDNDLSKSPYIPYNRYRVELESVTSSTAATATGVTTSTTNGPPSSP